MKAAVAIVVEELEHELPPQVLRGSTRWMPTRPASGCVMAAVRRWAQMFGAVTGGHGYSVTDERNDHG